MNQPKILFTREILTISNIAVECDSISFKLKENVLLHLHRMGGVIGISSGIVSSVTLALSVRALGAENVIGIMSPEKDSSPDSAKFATKLANKLGIR